MFLARSRTSGDKWNGLEPFAIAKGVFQKQFDPMKTYLLGVVLFSLYLSVHAGVQRHDLGYANQFTLVSGDEILGIYGSSDKAKADLVLLPIIEEISLEGCGGV